MAGAAAFGSDRAERSCAGLKALFALLAENPLMARLRADIVRPVRLYPYRAHVVASVEPADSILIVRALPGRQDWAWYLT
ncbi:Toxin ParE4 [Methylobacterium mesophilicum]|uniref:type II toxin-antitoxin system RelE/ParE family toxin n=1 Tax=Methylobacterium TaxID=407 RepID=UPI0011C8277E|nr:type II toxin-antitoxin system RelE/ParE family toxin [Methylobacterium sp. WL18]TXN72736.1 type II toxin-antitoxin system RelE/ParE family toxin [Methylobacterium sp. WL18]GJE21590.1 Toxin ParE4 [Methylobacterium mesophilicum]